MRNDEVVNAAVKRVSDEIMLLIEDGAEFKQVKRTLVDLLSLWEVVIFEDVHFYRVIDLNNRSEPLFSSGSFATSLKWVVDNVIRPNPSKRQVIAE